MDYTSVMKTATKVAFNVAGKFPSYVTVDDTEGALLLWIVQNAPNVEACIADGNEAMITSMLRKVAFDHCNSEKAHVEGYDPSDIYTYSIPKIKSLIADALIYENWQSFSTFGDGQPKAAVETYGERVTELIDIKNAFEKLDEDTQKFIKLQYVYGYTLEELADSFGISYKGADSRSTRALKGLARELGYKETPTGSQAGRRAHRTNASSRAELQNAYEG